MGNSAILGPTHYLFLPGSTAKAAQALPLPKLTTSEPYSKKNPPSRGRGIRLAGTVCFYTVHVNVVQGNVRPLKTNIR